MREVLLLLIRFYKRFISPHKGFFCAYRIHTGRASCSSLAYRAVRLRGAIVGLAILRQRAYLCGIARQRCEPQRRPRAAQRGDCDLGCDLPCDLNCDLPSPKLLSQCCNGLSCCDCGSCDWPERRRKDERQREKYVYIPPNGLRLQSHQRPSPSPPET
jgi:uncharacterized protein